MSIEFAAGVFEGEGTLCHKKDGYWELKVDMTDQDVVEGFANCLGISSQLTYQRYHPKTGDPYKRQWRARVQKTDKIFEVVCRLYPYLGERRKLKCQKFFEWYLEKKGETTN